MDLASGNAEDLNRAILMAETALAKMDESSCKSKWAQRTLGTLQEALPTAMSLRDDLRFLLKFRKDRAGRPLQPLLLTEQSELAEGQAQELQDLIGSLRSVARSSRG